MRLNMLFIICTEDQKKILKVRIAKSFKMMLQKLSLFAKIFMTPSQPAALTNTWNSLGFFLSLEFLRVSFSPDFLAELRMLFRTSMGFGANRAHVTIAL